MMKFAPFGENPLEIFVDAEKGTITLQGDLSDAYSTKINLSTQLSAIPKTNRWTIETDAIRFNESGITTWAEYVDLIFRDSDLKYLPSQFASVLFFDRGITYKHGRSEFEGM